MANAFKCDLCGKFYEGRRTRQIAVGMAPPGLNDHVVDRYDICSDCKESFEWWKASRNPNSKSDFEDKEDA